MSTMATFILGLRRQYISAEVVGMIALHAQRGNVQLMVRVLEIDIDV